VTYLDRPHLCLIGICYPVFLKRKAPCPHYNKFCTSLRHLLNLNEVWLLDKANFETKMVETIRVQITVLPLKCDTFAFCSCLRTVGTGTGTQVCGSAFISSGSRSSILCWIPVRIWIQYGSGSNPYPGLNDQKFKKKLQLKNFLFWIKNYNLPIPRPP
jgi:hypothetical protein